MVLHLDVYAEKNILQTLVLLEIMYQMYCYILYVQGVHKVSLQFEKFIAKASEKTDKCVLCN